MVAIELPQELVGQIRILQREFADKYGSAAALKPPVHITVSRPVHLDIEDLNTYRNLLRSVVMQAKPLNLILEGFDFFIVNRVVFIRVRHDDGLAEIHHRFEEVWYGKPSTRFSPHITIGYRNIDEAIFKTVMADYQQRNFEGAFTAMEVRLWKHESGYWKTLEQLPLIA